MKNNFIIELQNTINHMSKDISFVECLPILNKMENYLLDSDSLNKGEVIIILFNFMRDFYNVQDNLDKCSIFIQNIYESYREFLEMTMKYDMIKDMDIPAIAIYEELVCYFLEFIHYKKNSIVVKNNFKLIDNFRKELLQYQYKKDSNGISFKKYIDQFIIEDLSNKNKLLK